MSKLKEAEYAYTFDDFTLTPRHSFVKSRKDPQIGILPQGFADPLTIPIIASPMNTITERAMISSCCGAGASAVLHRYMSLSDQINICKELRFLNSSCWDWRGSRFWVAVGATGDYLERVRQLVAEGVNKICIDVANGHSESCLTAVRNLREQYKDSIHLMAGNVCSFEGALKLAEAGADSIRVGVGSGSICSTRVVSGHGVPQLTALEECSEVKKQYPRVLIISDGGFRQNGDFVKAIAIGADLCMTGSLLSGTPETPGEIIEENDVLYKWYAGMSSELGRESWFGEEKANYVPEGVAFKVPLKKQSAQEVVEQLGNGIKVGMSYAGAENFAQLREGTVWRRVTGAGYIEGTPHGKRS